MANIFDRKLPQTKDIKIVEFNLLYFERATENYQNVSRLLKK